MSREWQPFYHEQADDSGGDAKGTPRNQKLEYDELNEFYQG
jgi:hypothetical protein